MPIDKVRLANWTRKHDMPGSPLFSSTATILYPKSLEDLIEICAKREPFESLKAAGSHWALSYAAIPGSGIARSPGRTDYAAILNRLFIETHDPNDKFPAMGRTLYDVVPGCLNEALLTEFVKANPKPFGAANDVNEGTYLVHCETGKRVYQLYSELDLGDEGNDKSLAAYMMKEKDNSYYQGPWAFQTLGGAGGQTVFGALTTGTHGGDTEFPPIADSVVALHLVADGGRHY